MPFVWNSNTVTMDGEAYIPAPKTYRYCLTGNKDAKNPLVVIGLNPSIADNSMPDPTMEKLLLYMNHNKDFEKFDGFLMLNLYPLRTPSPDELKRNGIEDAVHQLNREKIRFHIKQVCGFVNEPSILLSCGVNIVKIKGLVKCFTDITEDIVKSCGSYSPKWFCLDTTKDGHPAHILYLKKDLRLKEFNIENYIEKFIGGKK